jgi:hypothetical protein
MHRHRLGALTAALLAVAPALAAAPERATLVGRYTWSSDAGWFGGFSAIEVSDDGDSFLALSDRGSLVSGRLVRDEGRITGTRAWRMEPLLGPRGRALAPLDRDSEGLARAPDGSFYVSFEGRARVVHYAAPGAEGRELPIPRDFVGLQGNSALEALAIDGQGRLYTLPERSGRINRPFPVYRWDGAAWTSPFAITRQGDFLVVAADFGPDGRLYVLERDFTGLFGFRSRIRAFDPRGDKVQPGETVLETPTGRFGNLEGLSVRPDPQGGLRLTLVADDNFSALLSTEIVEFRLDPLAPPAPGH